MNSPSRSTWRRVARCCFTRHCPRRGSPEYLAGTTRAIRRGSRSALKPLRKVFLETVQGSLPVRRKARLQADRLAHTAHRLHRFPHSIVFVEDIIPERGVLFAKLLIARIA